MVTPLAKEIWERKMALVDEFMGELSADIEMEVESEFGCKDGFCSYSV